jgi:plasmid stabilization system protein ParE
VIVVFTDEAERDIEHIADYTARDNQDYEAILFPET